MTSDFLPAGGTLPVGQFIVDESGRWFAGIVADASGAPGPFGVFAGTPERPLGTSIILCTGCGELAMTGTALTALSSDPGQQPLWTSPPAGSAPCFAIMQPDGNLCVYEGTGPDNQGAFQWGSRQAGGVIENFSPYPGQATSKVTVSIEERVEPCQWCIVDPNGNEGEYTQGNEAEITGVPGGSCYLRAKKLDGSDSHPSGDNFDIGDQNVSYSLSYDSNPLSPTFFSWSRTS